MMIKVLGTGCQGCLRLERNLRRALDELGMRAKVLKVTDVAEIVSYGVMRTPAVVVDEEVKVSGRVVEVKELKEILREVTEGSTEHV